MKDVDDRLDTVSRLLGRCVLIGFVFLWIWAAAFGWGRDFIDRQGQWFGLTPHECAVVAYAGMGFVKVLIIVFFLSPYIAIRLHLRKRKRGNP